MSKLYWKSEHVLDTIMQCYKDMQKVEANKDLFKMQKMLTFWRNKNAARMSKFLGFKYSKEHFIHSLALKPFYAASSKITIFFLS